MQKGFQSLVLKGALLFLVTGLSVLAAVGQTVSGTLRGTITDSNGASVPNATVVIRNVETGLERTVVSNDDGLFNAPFLPIGQYTVEATRNDFSKVRQENVTVSLNETTVVNLQLSPTVSGEVTITDESAPINTTNAQIAGSLTAEQITERPVLNQGNFLTLAETFTGYQENPTSGQNNPTTSSGSSINFNGTGSRGATFQINGVNNDDSSENQNRQGASLATVKEFQVITNNFTAEFGRGYGAVVLVQTKQGTNNIDGEAYWYHNDSALNARAMNAQLKPVNRRNQFGGVVGFPIVKNRLFGFLSLDHTENTGDNVFRRDVFLASERNPANWFQQTPANNTPENRAFIQSVLDRFEGILPNDPSLPRVYNGVQGFDFPARDYSGRFDWNASRSDTVFMRYQYTRQRFVADDIIVGERADQNNKQQNYGLTWTHIFNPNLVGEFRYGLGLRTTLVNIAAGNDTPILRFAGALLSGSTIGNAGTFPIQRYQTDNQIVYNLSAVIGSNHFLKAGTDIRFQKLDDLADNFSRGFWNFAATCNSVNYGTGFNAFLNGCISTYQRGYGPFFLEKRIGESNFYVEDNWKVSPNLTLNLGARYEYVKAPREVEDRINYGFGDDKNNIEPRVGFAYSPNFGDGWLKSIFGESGQFSIRGGYGIYHGRLFQSIFSQSGASVRLNPPNALLLSFTNRNTLTDPTGGFVFVPGPQATRHAEALVSPDLEMPYTQQWNLTFEKQLPWKSAVRVSYTGNRGIGLLRFTLDNLPVHDPANGVLVANHPNNSPGALGYNSLPANDPRRTDVRGQILRPAANLLCAGTGLSGVATNAQCPVAVPLGPLEYSFRVPRTNERRPDGRFTTNTLVSNNAWSYYHGLQIEFQKRLSSGLNFQASYTFSKTIDTTSEATAVGTGDNNQNGNDAKVARGLSRFHTPHRFTLFGTYRMPWFDKRNDVFGQILGGWQASMVFKWVHGTPFTVINGAGTDLNFDGFAESRPVIIDPSILGRSIDDPNNSQANLPASAFRGATINDFGNGVLGRNTFYVDGVKNFDFAFAKSFPLPFEGHRFYVRADLFNAFNHVQWGFPINDLSNAAFGRITGTATQYAPRTIQISLRYSF
ncbi:MAG TPA: TonB-dependent receptor [Pyrinomonadaceae bacterium]|jgi:outer membrane receptor protein involved in Fe transport